jgi:hypothetical protein
VVGSFSHKRLKGNDILEFVEMLRTRASILCNPAKRPHDPIAQIGGI